MPLRTQTKFYSNFAGGLITEANPLAFPEGTAKDISNMTLNRNGTAQRRLGIDKETDARNGPDFWTNAQASTWGVSAHTWDSVDGDGDLEFIVVQFGPYLYFYERADSVSSSLLARLEFTDLAVNDDFRNYQVDVTSGLGYLFVVGKYISPFYVGYDIESDTFTATKLNLKIRDIDGIPEENDTSGIISTLFQLSFTEDEDAWANDIDVDPATVDFNITRFTTADTTAYP